MFFGDMSGYSYAFSLDNVYNIGWLDRSNVFDTGVVQTETIEKLSDIFHREKVNTMRGIHYCNMCGLRKEQRSPIYNELLGMSEIWIPDKSGSKVYAAPSLIIHYMLDHMYKPCSEYLDAIADFKLEDSWTAKRYISSNI